MKRNLSNYRKPIYRLVASLILAIFISTTLFQSAIGKEIEVTFGETKVENFFPDGIRFSVKIDINDQRGVVTFHYRLGGDFWSYDSAKCSAKINDDNKVEYYSCVYYLDTKGLPPQLPISYKWQLYGSVDRTSEEKIATYENSNFDWQSLVTNNLTIWWHDHSSEFAQQLLSTSQISVQKQEALYGVKLQQPIQIVIQNSEDEFYEWRERESRSIGGEAFPWIGVTVQIIEMDMQKFFMDEWLNEVVPHEISHLFFFQVTAREHANPPGWLNEGMAGYNENSDHSRDWLLVRRAIQNETLIPLGDLRGNFIGDEEKIRLAYAEGTTAVIYIIETYHQEGLKKLFSAYQAGKNSDEAFLEAFGRTVSDFEKEWKIWVVERANQPSNTIKVLSYVLFSMAITCSCTLASIFVIIFLIVAFNNKIKVQPVPGNME